MPLSFHGSRPYFNSLSEWNLDPITGKWSVGKGNNYVLNGSFEADRRDVPIPVKPRQDYLLGWNTKVIKGNEVSLNNPHTPHLNHNNTEEERKQVIGEKSLCISDSIVFEREISQVIASSPFVPLTDGTYTLSLMVRSNGLFQQLEVNILSAGKKQTLDLRKVAMNNQWNHSQMEVNIAGGEATLSIHAKGKPLAQCLIDDITLIKK